MALTQEIYSLVDKYFDKIIVSYTDYEPMDDAEHDVACLSLLIPRSMLLEYAKLKGKANEIPDPLAFWLETDLITRLEASDKKPVSQHEPLIDILEFLHGRVAAQYSRSVESEIVELYLNEY